MRTNVLIYHKSNAGNTQGVFRINLSAMLWAELAKPWELLSALLLLTKISATIRNSQSRTTAFTERVAIKYSVQI